jgi:ribosomal protein S18 acetylase RimI-like enzyme
MILWKGVLMLEIRNARLKEIHEIKNSVEACSSNNYYSDFTGNILYYIIINKCFLIINNKKLQGILFIKENKKEVFYIPVNTNTSFFHFIYILRKYFNLNGYILNLRYKKISTQLSEKYFSICIKSDLKYMDIDLSNYEDGCNNTGSIHVRNMNIGKDETIRVNLQNEIFGNVPGRKNLTVKEIVYEENGYGFLNNYCFILEKNLIPAGYGQIIISGGEFYLVNFGIIPEYRNNGLGFIFLNEILRVCKKNGLIKLFLTVDKNNSSAIKLYLKSGFRDLYNNIQISL